MKPPVYEAIVINRVQNGYLLVDNTGDTPVCTVYTDLGAMLSRSRVILDNIENPPATGEGKLTTGEFTELLGVFRPPSNVLTMRPRNPREYPTDEHPEHA